MTASMISAWVCTDPGFILSQGTEHLQDSELGRTQGPVSQYSSFGAPLNSHVLDRATEWPCPGPGFPLLTSLEGVTILVYTRTRDAGLIPRFSCSQVSVGFGL